MTRLRGAIAVAVFCTLVPALAFAQTPRTAWGDPDLQGAWTNTTTTPLQRPAAFADKEFLTVEERAEFDARASRSGDRPPRAGDPGTYNTFWLDRGSRTARTSLIIDPPNGRLPAITPNAQKRADDLAALRESPSYPATWGEPSVYEQCLTRGMPATMMPGFYNHNYLILQTPGHVVIHAEMIHDTRIIPVDGGAPLPARLRQWLGGSRGRWEGETLVVETTNFTDKVYERRPSNAVYGASAEMHIEERFTRVDAEMIDYRFTVTDPTTFETPWTAAIPMTPLASPVFEYACHEGNYGMENMLRGAREQDLAAGR